MPEDGVVYEGADAHVWVAYPDSKKLELRRIAVGRVSHGMVEVSAGLKAGESVVTSGSVFIDRALAGD
jgi:cobalt-zinc-cadmium efflux system membrane fusion protein